MPKVAKTPGSVLKAKIDAYQLTAAAVAKDLKTKNLGAVLSDKGGIDVDLAIRLAKYFGGKPEEWIKIQLTASKKELAAEIKSIPKAKKPAAAKKGKPGRKPAAKKTAAKKPAGRKAADKKPGSRGRKPAAAKKTVKTARAIKTVRVPKKPAAPVSSTPPSSFDL